MPSLSTVRRSRRRRRHRRPPASPAEPTPSVDAARRGPPRRQHPTDRPAVRETGRSSPSSRAPPLALGRRRRVVLLVAMFVHGLVTNPGWDWPTFAASSPPRRSPGRRDDPPAHRPRHGARLRPGARARLDAAVDQPVPADVAWAYIWAFRSIPLIVQLLFWFNLAYLYQELSVGIPFGPAFVQLRAPTTSFGALGAAVLGLALHQAAYAAEIVRGGILSVDEGQLRGGRGARHPAAPAARDGSCCRRRCARSCRTPPTR